jgi:hypothetical protein
VKHHLAKGYFQRNAELTYKHYLYDVMLSVLVEIPRRQTNEVGKQAFWIPFTTPFGLRPEDFQAKIIYISYRKITIRIYKEKSKEVYLRQQERS